VVVKQELDYRGWLDIGKILVRQPGHRAFERLYLLSRLQGVLVGLVLYRPAIAIAQGHND